MPATVELPESVAAFFEAVNARDAARAARSFTDDIRYQFLVPYSAREGRAAVEAALAESLREADRVRWDITSVGFGRDAVFVERVDRFWFGDREAAIECTGVFTLRDGLIAEIRDYADLGTWRERKASALG